MSDPYSAPSSSQYTRPIDPLTSIHRQLRDLRRQLLERGSPLKSAAVSDGSLVVKDQNQNPQLRLGKMSVGGYGLEALDPDTGKWWPMSAAASLQSSASYANPITIDLPANQDSGWVGYGPSVKVTTYTGRITVTISACLAIRGTGAAAAASWQLEGPMHIPADRNRGVALTHGSDGLETETQGSFSYVHTVKPGVYIITAKYFQISGMDESSTGTAKNLTLIARTD